MKQRSKAVRGGITLQAGETESGKVWIGAPDDCYDYVQGSMSRDRLHILCFTIKQAEAAIAMLQTEIERQKNRAQATQEAVRKSKRTNKTTSAGKDSPKPVASRD